MFSFIEKWRRSIADEARADARAPLEAVITELKAELEFSRDIIREERRRFDSLQENLLKYLGVVQQQREVVRTRPLEKPPKSAEEVRSTLEANSREKWVKQKREEALAALQGRPTDRPTEQLDLPSLG